MTDLEQARQVAQGDNEDRTITKPVLNSGECPTGCGRKVSLGKLLCGHCWPKVPYDLQRQVILTWRRHLKLIRGTRTAAQVKVSRATYEAAKEAAIASVA